MNTYNNPVTYVLTTAKLDVTEYRWLAELAAISFDIKYRPGKTNAYADTLSLLPIISESIQSICNVAMSESYIGSLTLTSDAVLKDLDLRGSEIGNIVDWRKDQE